MSTFLLVHGGWHGAWCWFRIRQRLQKAGHRVLAPDLPSLGIEKTPITQISLDTWTDRICEILNAEIEPVTLLGHSRGGIVISEAAERHPEKVKTLVYLAAFMLRDGESLLQALQEDTRSMLHSNIVFAADGSFTTVREGAIRDIFYQRCTDDDVALASLLLAPEAVAPSVTPIRITDTRFGRVPRVYIECTLDNAIPLDLQRKMCARLPCRTLTIESDHSPFFSAPDDLVKHLLALDA